MNFVILEYAIKSIPRYLLVVGLAISGHCFADLPAVSDELQRVMHDFLNRPSSIVGGDARLIEELGALANQGDPVAAYLYAVQIDEIDPTTSKKMFGYASSKGCTAASTILGGQLIATEKSSDAGVRLMKESAYSGDPLAQMGLAGHFLKLENPVQAYAWFSLAYKELSAHPLMKATLDAQRAQFESRLSIRQKKIAESRYKQLTAQVKPMPTHPCASSVIAVFNIPPQASTEEAPKQNDLTPHDTSNWKLFDHANLVADPVKFKQIKSDFPDDQPVLVIISASWDIGKYEIEHWVNSDPQLHRLLSTCHVIVGDVTANLELRGLYEGDKRSVPVYAKYKKSTDELPRETRLTNFQTAQEFKQFVEDTCLPRAQTN